MLAMGWNIERTKEGDAMFQQRESEKLKKISESLVTKHYSYTVRGGSELLVMQIHPQIKSHSATFQSEPTLLIFKSITRVIGERSFCG